MIFTGAGLKPNRFRFSILLYWAGDESATIASTPMHRARLASTPFSILTRPLIVLI